MNKPDTVLEKVVELGKLALLFGRTNRKTFHDDGTTLESDTDHTVMLSLIACAFAQQFEPKLDIGKIAQFALVHDLVEAYAGDTPTFTPLSQTEVNDKQEREQAAFEKIKQQFGESFPWIHETIEEYETLESPEARYVKTMDKVMPKITHLVDGGAFFKTNNTATPELLIAYDNQYEKITTTYGHDQVAVTELYKQFIPHVQSAIEQIISNDIDEV